VLLTTLSVINAVLALGLIIILLKFKRSVPVLLQGALNDVGAQLSGIFKEAPVKRAMSVLGKQSGSVRASAALKNRVAKKAIGQSPLIGAALKYFGITPLQGLELMNDPTIGPMIQRFMAGASKGLGGLSSAGVGGSSSRFKGYGVEE
jgi:hypothetical protein